jgi:hypothetical protein
LTLTLSEGSLYSVDLVLNLDPAVITITQTAVGDLASGWLLVSNMVEPGVLQVALAGAAPIVSGGELLLFSFEAVGASGDESDLTLTALSLNEGGIPTHTYAAPGVYTVTLTVSGVGGKAA